METLYPHILFTRVDFPEDGLPISVIKADFTIKYPFLATKLKTIIKNEESHRLSLLSIIIGRLCCFQGVVVSKQKYVCTLDSAQNQLKLLNFIYLYYLFFKLSV